MSTKAGSPQNHYIGAQGAGNESAYRGGPLFSMTHSGPHTSTRFDLKGKRREDYWERVPISGPRVSFNATNVSLADRRPPVGGGKAYNDQSRPFLVLHNAGGRQPYAPPPPRFQPFGIEGVPVQAKKNELCIQYLHNRCAFGARCTRIHPTGSKYYSEKLRDERSAKIFNKASDNNKTLAPSTQSFTNPISESLERLIIDDSTTSSQGTSLRPPEEFQAFGIKALPTKALKDEVCIAYLHDKCIYGFHCDRIHPKDTQSYLEKLRDQDSQGIFWNNHNKQHIDQLRQHPPTKDSNPQRRADPPKATRTKAALNNAPAPLQSRTSSSSTETSDYEVLWDVPVEPDRWLTGNSSPTSSEEPIPESHYSPSPQRSLAEPESPEHQPLPDSSRHGLSIAKEWRQLAHKPFGADDQRGNVRTTSRLSLTPGLCLETPLFLVKRQAICQRFLQGRCWRGKSCLHRHVDASVITSTVDDRGSDSAPDARLPGNKGRPLPPENEICTKWLRNECRRGYGCNFIHRDLEYDTQLPRRKIIIVPPRKPPEVLSRILHEHIKVKVSDGFEIQDVVTAFETSWIFLGNVPKATRQSEIYDFLKRHGDVGDIRMPEKINSAFITVRARFVTAAEATRVCALISGVEAFGTNITARLSLDKSSTAAIIHDTSVRMTWDAPSKRAIAGYTIRATADEAISKCRMTPFGDRLLRARIHTGLPAVGKWNVAFEGVPPTTSIQDFKAFCLADDIIWMQTNYSGTPQSSIQDMERYLRLGDTDILEIEVMHPPYRAGAINAWVHLPTPADAKTFCERVHNRKPACVGHTRIVARHVQSLEYSLDTEVFHKLKCELEALKRIAAGMGHCTVTFQPLPSSTQVRFTAEDVRQLRRLKAELDVILSGEIIRENGKTIWDPFFSQMRGVVMLTALEKQYRPVTVQADKVRKTIRLFGPAPERALARERIMEEVKKLADQTMHILQLDGWLIGAFIQDEFPALLASVGEDNVQLDLWERSLRVRGDIHARDEALDSITRARRKQKQTRAKGPTECPVCLGEVVAPVTLSCGHSWCKTCLTRYLFAAIDQRFFPVTCLGDDAKCTEKIPLDCASLLLTAAEFDSLVETAFATYLQHRPTEFAYCPTADCQQVYRPVERVSRPPKAQATSASASTTSSVKGSSSAQANMSVGTVLQCPSCLVRICASCQTEAHDGLTCLRPDEGDSLFSEWMKENDVKPCPGCKMPIEKVTGCHHVMCTMCSTHLCWICLTPFSNGAGVYSHMLAEHGTFV